MYLCCVFLLCFFFAIGMGWGVLINVIIAASNILKIIGFFSTEAYKHKKLPHWCIFRIKTLVKDFNI